ncbi:MAG TPA: hypothetical protein VMB05_12270 [Solirubrobacteraceae bacterium]|nr:hypothetical protein [Solirubrobacteraceae bacterium]
MASRFASNLTVLLIGASLATACFAFEARAVAWLAFAAGAGVVLTVVVTFAMRERGVTQRVFDGFVLLLAAWTIVFSLTFAPNVVHWLAFASAATLVLLAFAGLVVHEVLVELALRRGLYPVREPQAPAQPERATLGAVS